MNARFYDPQIGRFMSADPVGGSASDPQSFNPYAYVGDNPLSLTDPTGLCFLGCFWHSPIFKVVAAVAVAVTLQYEVLPALAGDATGFAAAATIPASTEIAFAGVSGAAAGAISTGTWQGALLGAASAVTFYGIGNVTTPWLTTPAADAAPDGAFTVTNYVGVGASAVVHGLAGGMISVAEGGNFQSGFLSAGVSDLPGPFYANNAAVAGMEETVVGGASSVLGGGKFANGAVTAGFSFVFNNLSDLHNTRQGFTAGLMGGTVAATACDVGTVGACALADPGIISTTTAFGTIQGFIHDAAETFWEWFNNRSTPDQEALGGIVKDVTRGGKIPLSNGDANQVIEWGKEVGSNVRDDRGTSHWVGGSHIHVPGSGVKHIPVDENKP